MMKRAFTANMPRFLETLALWSSIILFELFAAYDELRAYPNIAIKTKRS
jgi:hypothetical protein